MSDDRQVKDPPYRVYGREGARPDADGGAPPYKVFKARPRGLKALLRGEEEIGVPGGPGREPPVAPKREPGERPPWRERITPKRVLISLVAAIVGWLLLSLVLFMISASTSPGIPADAQAALSSGPNMLTGTDTVLVLGTDLDAARARAEANHQLQHFSASTSDAGSNSDTIMLWRIGGGTSRRLSIPRDTVAEIPGHGLAKINAAYAFGGTALAIKTVESFTGLKINHVIVVNLAAFAPFIDAIGGIDLMTGRVCSDISGGARNGGWSLYLSPGTHHLSGIQALTYARTRDNKCNIADTDLTRVQHQQQILNAIKSQLFSLGTFFRLPWASWDAPKVVRTDMGGPTLLSLFAASEIGGSAPVKVLKPTGAEALPGYGNALTVTPQAVQAAVSQLMNG